MGGQLDVAAGAAAGAEFLTQQQAVVMDGKAGLRVGSVLAAIGFIGLWVWVGVRLGFPARLGAAGWGSLALGLLLWRDAAEGDGAREGAIDRTARAGLWGSVLLFAIGAWVASSSLQLVGLGGVLLADQAQRKGWRGLGGLPWLVGLICLPQGVLEDTVLIALQRGAAGMASWGLDLLGIAHVAQGVVLELPGSTLFVEEACSGMRSLVTGLILLQAWFCKQRLGFGLSAVALAAAALLLIGANSARILTTAVLQAAGHEMWTTGTRHDAVGWAWFCLAIGLGAALPWALTSVFAICRDRGMAGGDGVPMGRIDAEWRAAAALKALLGGLPRLTCLAVVVMSAAMVPEVLRVAGGGETASTTGNVRALEAGLMPLELAGWRRDDRATGSGFLEGFALHQQRWLYRKGGRRAWVAADLPFPDIHPLPICYAARDWQVLRNDAHVPAGGAPLTVLELRSKSGNRAPMRVMFDHYDLGQKRFAGGLPSRLASRWETVRRHLDPRANEPAKPGGPYCQLQVVADGVVGIDSQAGLEALRLFEAARVQLARSLEAP